MILQAVEKTALAGTSGEASGSLQSWQKLKQNLVHHREKAGVKNRGASCYMLLNDQILWELTPCHVDSSKWYGAKPFMSNPSRWLNHLSPGPLPTLRITFKYEIWEGTYIETLSEESLCFFKYKMISSTKMII